LIDLQVNGESLLGTSHQEAVRALQYLSTAVALLVCDGYNNRHMTPGKPVNGFSMQVMRLSVQLCYICYNSSTWLCLHHVWGDT